MRTKISEDKNVGRTVGDAWRENERWFFLSKLFWAGSGSNACLVCYKWGEQQPFSEATLAIADWSLWDISLSHGPFELTGLHFGPIQMPKVHVWTSDA